MCPEQANIFYIEDDEVAGELDQEYLECKGHHIVESATSLSEALEKIPNLSEKNVNVVITDGNLVSGISNNADGIAITKAIHKKYPKLPVVGHTKNEPIANANLNCSKKAGLVALEELVAKI